MPACKLLVSVVMLGLIAPVAVSAEPNLLDPSLSDAEVIEGIRSHWKKRAEGVTSLALEVETESTDWIDLREIEGLDQQRVVDPNEPLAEPKPIAKPLRWHLRYFAEQDKVAFHKKLLNADQFRLHPEIVTATSLAFDGERTTCFHFSREPAYPVAFVDVGKKPAQDLSNNSRILPFVFWRDPGEMFRIGRWNSKQIEVVDRHLDVEGRECIRLALKRRGGDAPPHIAWLDVDPARGAAPVRWQHRQGDRVLYSIEIEYDDARGPAPSGWTYNVHPARRGNPGSTYYAQVKTAKLNEDVADENFEVVLPAGTLVREKEGKEEREYTIGSGGEGPLE